MQGFVGEARRSPPGRRSGRRASTVGGGASIQRRGGGASIQRRGRGASEPARESRGRAVRRGGTANGGEGAGRHRAAPGEEIGSISIWITGGERKEREREWGRGVVGGEGLGFRASGGGLCRPGAWAGLAGPWPSWAKGVQGSPCLPFILFCLFFYFFSFLI